MVRHLVKIRSRLSHDTTKLIDNIMVAELPKDRILGMDILDSHLCTTTFWRVLPFSPLEKLVQCSW